MDKEKVFLLLEELNDKKNKIRGAREKLDKKRKNIVRKQDVSFDNIDEFLSNNSETIEQLERMEESIKLLEKQFENDEWELSSALFEGKFPN